MRTQDDLAQLADLQSQDDVKRRLDVMTFRFSGVADAQARSKCTKVLGCVGALTAAVVAVRNTGRPSASRAGSQARAITYPSAYSTLDSPVGLFVPKPSSGVGYQRRSMRGLRQTVRGCPLTSTVGRGDCHSLCHSVAREPVVSVDCYHPHAFQACARLRRRSWRSANSATRPHRCAPNGSERSEIGLGQSGYLRRRP